MTASIYSDLDQISVDLYVDMDGHGGISGRLQSMSNNTVHFIGYTALLYNILW